MGSISIYGDLKDETFTGIRVEGQYEVAKIEDLVSSGARSEDLTWRASATYDTIFLQVTASYLRGSEAMTPAEVMSHIFTDGYSLSSRGATLMSNTSYSPGGVTTGTDDKEESLTETALAYLIDTVILRLPPLDERGFFDSNRTFGLGWDFDVYYKTKTIRLGYSTSTWHEWIEIDAIHSPRTDDPTKYPSSDMTTWGEDHGGMDWYSKKGLDGITYGQSVLGFDYYDTVVAPGSASPNSNDFLHSNDVYRVLPDDLDAMWSAMEPSFTQLNGSAHQSDGFEVSLSYNDLDPWTPGQFTLKTTYDKSTKLVFKSMFHGATTGEIYPYELRSDQAPYGGDRSSETQRSVYSIDAACEGVLEEYNITEWPKRLINHVQRRQGIPDTALSALGTTSEGAEDKYTTTTAASGVGTSEDYWEASMDRG
jgi:hypothetical protein